MTELHRVAYTAALVSMSVKTSDQVTHVACPDHRTTDGNDAVTLCGLLVHHCNLQRCRHTNRHKGRLFSVRVPGDAPTDCMTCLTQQAELDGQ